MALKSDAKFEEKLTCGLKNHIWQIFTTAFESVKIGTLIGSICAKQKMHELKIYRGAMCNDIEE